MGTDGSTEQTLQQVDGGDARRDGSLCRKARDARTKGPPPFASLEPGPERLATALDERLAVWTRPDGTVMHTLHCRQFRGGCRARIAAFAEMLYDAASRHGIDPFLLAAVAVQESALDPSAVGSQGSVGIVQLHPRGVGGGLRVVRDARYREWCARHRPAGCQAEVVERGAQHLAGWIELCGEVPAGLGGYNMGECGRTGYARRVMYQRDRLVELALPPKPAVGGSG